MTLKMTAPHSLSECHVSDNQTQTRTINQPQTVSIMTVTVYLHAYTNESRKFQYRT